MDRSTRTGFGMGVGHAPLSIRVDPAGGHSRRTSRMWSGQQLSRPRINNKKTTTPPSPRAHPCRALLPPVRAGGQLQGPDYPVVRWHRSQLHDRALSAQAAKPRPGSIGAPLAPRATRRDAALAVRECQGQFVFVLADHGRERQELSSPFLPSSPLQDGGAEIRQGTSTRPDIPLVALRAALRNGLQRPRVPSSCGNFPDLGIAHGTTRYLLIHPILDTRAVASYP